MPLLALHSLVKQYGEFRAVNAIDLEVAESELVCLLGPSGCGKTTTLRMIGGFIRPDQGDIRIDGQSVLSQAPERRPTAMVFQKYTLWPHMDVWHNVAFGLQLRHWHWHETDEAVRHALDLVGLNGSDRKYPSQLSGGQQQRVALARALVLEPRILLLDEPFSNLDAQLRIRMREEVRAIQQRVGITTVFVTHDQSEALAIADRIVVMSDGRIEQIGPPSEVYATPSTLFVASFVGSMNFLPAELDGDGRFKAAEFSGSVPALKASSTERSLPDARIGRKLLVATRPEDVIILGSEDEGVPARVIDVMDMGHYRHVNIETEGEARLTSYVDKGQPLPAGACRVALRRSLVYVGERFGGETVAHDRLKARRP